MPSSLDPSRVPFEPEQPGRIDQVCQFLERRPFKLFAFQAVVAVAAFLGVRSWLQTGVAEAPAALAAAPATSVEEPLVPPVRPFAQLAPTRPEMELPGDHTTSLLDPAPIMVSFSLNERLQTMPVALPKGGRTVTPGQAEAVEREHRNFLASMEILADISDNNTKGKKGAISPDEDLLRSDPKPPQGSMSDRVDFWLVQSWRKAGVVPAPPATDDEFLRRLYLDLRGVIPTYHEARTFLDDGGADRRERLIDALLASDAHAEYLAGQWTNVLLPMDSEMDSSSASNFERWLRLKFSKNIPYHRIVAELINPGPLGGGGAAGLYNARRGMPEELAADTARFLLGVQIQCAQCHNHPFDRWTVEDFKGYVAFFQDQAGFRNRQAGKPKFLGGDEVDAPSMAVARKLLADWITARQNPYFARATVNRVWGMMFGRGLVDPIDDLSPNHPPSHPQLLNELATYFVASGHDLRGLIRMLALTKGYQLSSQTPVDDPTDGELFASMALKNLGTETMIDCLTQVMNDRLAAARPRTSDDNLRREFLQRFGRQARGGVEYEGGIPQALWMMNGPMMNQLASSSIVLAAADMRSNDERSMVLFLATLSRYPNPRELRRTMEFLDERGAHRRREALADLLWALLNSAEFVMNH